MKRSRKLMARAAALAMAAVMMLGLSVTAFAADKDTSTIDKISGGASDALHDGDYPSGLADAGKNLGGGSLGVDQYVDKNWVFQSDGINGTNGDTGTITVSGLDAGVAVDAYQIIKPKYENGGSFSGYEDLTGIGFVDSVGNAVADKFSRENIALAAKWALKNGTAIKMDVAGDTATKAVQPGSYVILVTATGKGTSEIATYGAMVVSCYYTYQDKNGVNNGTLSLVKNLAYAKKQSAPGINKIISGVAEVMGDDTSDINRDATVVDIGDYVWFDIRVENIPEYHGEHSVFHVTDTIDGGLKYDPASVKIVAFYGTVGDKHTSDDPNLRWDGDTLKFLDKVGDVQINDITGSASVTADGNAIKFDFVNGGKYQLNDYAGYDLIIRYRAQVTGEGHDNYENGIIDMSNAAGLTFTHNSNVEGNTDTKPDDPVHVYTCIAEVLKTEADGTTPLPGAEFELYTYLDGEKYAYDYNNTDEGGNLNDGAIYSKIVSDENGKIVLKGLSSGTYYLKETKAPDGWSLNGNEYKIVIGAFETDDKAFDNDSSKTVFKAVVKYGTKDAEGDALKDSLAIPNSQMTELPSTGGAGTALLVGVGILGAIVGMFVLFGTRKKQDD